MMRMQLFHIILKGNAKNIFDVDVSFEVSKYGIDKLSGDKKIHIVNNNC